MYVSDNGETMRTATTRMTIATLALGLLSCGGASDGETTFVSRIADATSRSLMSAIVESEERNESEASSAPTPEPLMLAASRPDSILGSEGLPSDNSALRSAVAVSRHVVTPTVIPTFARKCGESTYRMLEKPLREARLETADCPLLNRRRAGNLTRI